jgi:hypothetical protein
MKQQQDSACPSTSDCRDSRYDGAIRAKLGEALREKHDLTEPAKRKVGSLRQEIAVDQHAAQGLFLIFGSGRRDGPHVHGADRGYGVRSPAGWQHVLRHRRLRQLASRAVWQSTSLALLVQCSAVQSRRVGDRTNTD